MTAKPLIFRALAAQDIDEITTHYTSEAGADVALRFTDALQAAQDAVARQPAIGSPRLGHALRVAGLRTRHVRRFPYLILYVEHDSSIEIVRILHKARDIPASLSEPG